MIRTFDVKKTLLAALAVIAAGALVFSASAALASGGGAKHLKTPGWSFDGPTGTYDRAQLQRGYLVYRDVCAGCHGLKYIAFRNLLDIGFNEAEAKAVAAEFDVEDGPDAEGEMFSRPAILSDIFPSPYANDNAARAANNGALPPDLSLMAKARAGGADYIYSLMIGYEDPPEGFELPEGMSYNPYFPSAQIAMPAPMDDDSVEYVDGTKATLDQEARDVAAFLMWAAEPKLEDRHRIGLKTLLFLIVLTALFYLTKRRVWRDVH